MKKSERIFKELKRNQLIALLTPKSTAECIKAYEVCREYGIILEIAFRSEYAVEGIKTIIKKYPDALLLAGTVMTETQAKDAINAGASGIVSADYIPAVVDICVREDVMCIPGGLSDAGKQLVQKAEVYGYSLEELRLKYPYQWVYKLFPAFSGRVSNIDLASSWKGPFKELVVVYTGGITLNTLKEAVQKDPNGIFCASAFTRHLDDPKAMKKELDQWKNVLKSKIPQAAKIPRKKIDEDSREMKVVTFGELMIRLSPPPGVRLKQTQKFDVHFGGAEANVAVSLAQFGLNAFFVTALPENDMGDNACDTLKKFGVDTRFILRKGNRMGIYYLEHGAGPRPSKVIYDRSNSAICEIEPGDIDWEQVLSGANWFHWTGITPALNKSLRSTLRDGLKTARKKGITVSADINYRKKLWSEDEAQLVMTEFMPFVDIIIGNEEDPIKVFGIKPKGTDVTRGKLEIEGYKELAKTMIEHFGFKKVTITLRESISASENLWSACLFDGKNFFQSPKHRVWIVDRVGTGDAFAAGLIYSFLKGKTDSEALSFGVAAACLKHSIYGDFNPVSVQEVGRIAAGETTGRVQR
ncbi:MAG: KHG/KDPG aldolase/sugar kinase fusion protein [Acidobacteriota bacterium]|nr:KHG/KDPG aldolase/sugar kinase fusion protein [Acidobacteriota bacterium]